MALGPRISMWIWLLVAAALFAGTGMLQQPLERRSEKLKQSGGVVTQQNPEMALYELLPGVLKAFWIHYDWIRAEQLKNDGRYFDAMQRASRICRLQPRFAGVWAFQAWNMSWNISVATHTKEERWRWVYNGVRLLRDEGIPLNPRSLLLYKELSWIFFSKMGGTTDEMHREYKRRWAGMMQHLLGAPAGGTSQETIDAFRPIAESDLLDKTPRRKGREIVQADVRERLLQDPGVAAYAAALAELGVAVDEHLLEAYSRFSRDDAVEITRVGQPELETERDKKLSALINDPDQAAPRRTLLTFVRAQVLWNRYKMDPAWMLRMMERYGPIDWRLVWPHGLYWATYGMHVVTGISMEDIDTLNTGRIVLNCLKDMTWQGRMTYQDNPQQPDWPRAWLHADGRFIDYTQKEYLRLIDKVVADRDQPFEKNMYKDGHINYLIAAIEMLYAGYRHDKARDLFEWIKTQYKQAGGDWDLGLGDFVFTRITREGSPIAQLAINQITAAVQTAYVLRLQGNVKGARDSMRYAVRVYNAYQKDAPRRLTLPSMAVVVRDILAVLLVAPRSAGYNLSVVARSRMYSDLISADMRLMLYDMISRTRRLRQECWRRGLDFDRAFPEPPGLEDYRRRQLERFGPALP